jgi:hypothetical protein
MKKTEKRNIKVNKELADSIEEFIEAHPEIGYNNIEKFFEDAAQKRHEEFIIWLEKYANPYRKNLDSSV